MILKIRGFEATMFSITVLEFPSSLYLLIQNENVHVNSLFLLYIHDCEISIVGIPTYAIDSIVLDP